MMLIYVILLSILWAYGENTDPCVSNKWLKDDGGRSSHCDLPYDECDRYIEESWYRVTTNEDSPLTIPLSCVDMLKCGTVYPIWMNGSLPTVSEGTVNRTACVSTPDDCCGHSYNFMVKNCTSFYVYYLIRTDGCNERYCFGDHKQCPTTTTSITTTPSTSQTTFTTTITTTTTTAAPTTSNLSYLNPVTFVLLGLSMCLMGTTVGLATILFLRHKRERKIDTEPPYNVSPPPPYFQKESTGFKT